MSYESKMKMSYLHSAILPVSKKRQDGGKGHYHNAAERIAVARLYMENYKGFGPELTSEKLFEKDRIELSKETVRK